MHLIKFLLNVTRLFRHTSFFPVFEKRWQTTHWLTFQRFAFTCNPEIETAINLCFQIQLISNCDLQVCNCKACYHLQVAPNVALVAYIIIWKKEMHSLVQQAFIFPEIIMLHVWYLLTYIYGMSFYRTETGICPQIRIYLLMDISCYCFSWKFVHGRKNSISFFQQKLKMVL